MSNLDKKEVGYFFNAYILSVDTIISSVLSIGLVLFLPLNIKSSFALSFYNVGITVLSIIFSLFFAALAIIMSSTDNDFIKYMEERVNKGFTRFMNTFKVVLVALFLSLIYSIVLYTTTDFYIKNNNDTAVQNKYLFIVFQFLFSYSLIATAQSIRDTITYTSYRTKFLIGQDNPPSPKSD